MFIISSGSCEVFVKDHLRKNQFVRELQKGKYFGELGLLNLCKRSASIQSSNYTTLVEIGKSSFIEMCNSFPEVYSQLKENTSNYNDPWIKFKRVILG